ncbi:hypothetical protein Hanom_Chr10g00937961 [Helianthus anomalus]
MYIPKNFYRTRGSKTYIPKNFYTKTTYITLLTEKFGGSGAPPGPFKVSPLLVAELEISNRGVENVYTQKLKKFGGLAVPSRPYYPMPMAPAISESCVS